MMQDKWDVVIGKIVSAFGLKGEVKVWPYPDYREYFEHVKTFCISGETAGNKILKARRIREQKSSLIIKFAGIDDISEAENLRDAEVRIRESDLKPLGEDEFLIEDIVGLEAWSTEGEYLGKVTEVLQAPANDVFITDRAMIPAVKEFVERVDLKEKKIIVRKIEGMVQE